MAKTDITYDGREAVDIAIDTDILTFFGYGTDGFDDRVNGVLRRYVEDETFAKEINRGIEELQRGEGLDGEKVMADLREKSRQRRAAI